MISIYNDNTQFNDALNWACNELSLDDYDADVIIEWESDDENDNLFGYMEYEDTEFVITVNPKLNKCISETLRTIFHELVHVKQVLEGRLAIVDGLIHYNGHRPVITTLYDETEWEKEAISVERELSKKYEMLI